MIFKRNISRDEARQSLRDKAMRKALLELLQEATKDLRECTAVPMPDPMLDDDDVKKELKRILKL